MIKRNYHFIISTVVHLLLAVILINLTYSGGTGFGKKGDKTGQGPSRFQGVQVGDHIIPKEKVEITVIEVDKSPGMKKKPSSKKRLVKTCKGPWYGGIGMQSGFNLETHEEYVAKVFPGYPGDVAGIQAGDVIEEVVGGQILGDPGTYVTLLVKRNGSRMTFTIMRDRICYYK